MDRLYATVEELRAAAPHYRSTSWPAERFEVSGRTIERDLAALQQSGVTGLRDAGTTGRLGLCSACGAHRPTDPTGRFPNHVVMTGEPWWMTSFHTPSTRANRLVAATVPVVAPCTRFSSTVTQASSPSIATS